MSSFFPGETPADNRARARYVVGPLPDSSFYLQLMHAGMLHETPRAQQALIEAMHDVARRVQRTTLRRLWPLGWRESMMASWWTAARGWTDMADDVTAAAVDAAPDRHDFDTHCIALTGLAVFPGVDATGRLARILTLMLAQHPDRTYALPTLRACVDIAAAREATSVPEDLALAWDRAAGADATEHARRATDTVERMTGVLAAVATKTAAARLAVRRHLEVAGPETGA